MPHASTHSPSDGSGAFSLYIQSETPGKVGEGLIEVVADEESASGTVLRTGSCIAVAFGIDVMPESVYIRRHIARVYPDLLHNLSRASDLFHYAH